MFVYVCIIFQDVLVLPLFLHCVKLSICSTNMSKFSHIFPKYIVHSLVMSQLSPSPTWSPETSIGPDSPLAISPGGELIASSNKRSKTPSHRGVTWWRWPIPRNYMGCCPNSPMHTLFMIADLVDIWPSCGPQTSSTKCLLQEKNRVICLYRILYQQETIGRFPIL